MGEDKVQKSLVEVWNRYGMQKAARKSRFFFKEMIWKEYSSGLSRLLRENKPNTEMGLTLSRILQNQ